MSNVFKTFLEEKGLYDSIEINGDNFNDLISLINGDVKLDLYCKKCKEKRVYNMEPIKYYYKLESNNPGYAESIYYNDDEYLGRYEVMNLSDEIKEANRSYENPTSIYFPVEVDIPNNRNLEDDKIKKTINWKFIKSSVGDEARIMVFKYMCAMDKEHNLDFVVTIEDNKLKKIGQYPTVADLTFPELDKYKHVISKEDRSDMRRAIGLYANGIGTGSYVYLRRVFERMLSKAKEEAGDSIDHEKFGRVRVNEKIEMISDYLPDMLTENHTIYGILSKGIHELSEEECLKYFPVLKDCIFVILEEWESIRKKKEREDSIKKEISKITSELTR